MTAHRIAVLGDGAMATVCAMLLDGNGHRVVMWGPFAEHVRQNIAAGRNVRYLPEHPFPPRLHLTADEREAVEGADLALVAIPSQFVRGVCERFIGRLGEGVPIVTVTKGIECETLLRPTQVIADVLGGERPLAALCGPSIAGELAAHLPATVCAAGEDEAFIQHVQALFTTSWFRVYTNTDLVGVELAAATKNVIAIAAGILDGLEMGINAKSALLARGLAEITRLGVAMGARMETFFGVAGVGDLATTCFSPSGRNRSAGEMLGRGMTLDEVIAHSHGVVEGAPTTRSVVRLAERHQVDMPITRAIHDVLYSQLAPRQAVAQLMSREPKQERIA